MRRRFDPAPLFAILASLCFSFGLPARTASAAWQPNGNPIGLGATISPDGRGGLFSADGGTNALTGNIIHLDASGGVASGWPAAGIELVPGNRTSGAHDDIGPNATLPDGNGGLYVLTSERGPYPGSGGFLNPWRLYIHRRTSTGDVAPGWQEEGVEVETTWLWPPFTANNRPEMASDGQGGVLVVWSQANYDWRVVWAQRVTGEGRALWGDDGRIVTTSANLGSLPAISDDARGGALVFWAEWNDPGTALAIRAQHLTAKGDLVWESEGRQVSASTFSTIDQSLALHVSLNFSPHGPAIRTVSDGQGGAILAWSGGRGGDLDVFATRVGADGRPVWGGDLLIGSGSGDQNQPSLAAAPGNSLAIVWTDHDGPTSTRIAAQAVTLGGRMRWEDGGVTIAGGAGRRGQPVARADGRDGIVIAWSEDAGGGQLWTQRMTISGRPATGWPAAGRLVSTTAHFRADFPLHLQAIEADRGSVILGWWDVRDAVTPPLVRSLAMLVTPDGPASDQPVGSIRSPRADSDRFFIRGGQEFVSAGRAGSVTFALPEGERATLEVVDLSGRRVFTREVGGTGGGPFELNIAEQSDLRAGVYFVRLQLGTQRATARVAVIR